jgi:prevent-host-death family protein
MTRLVEMDTVGAFEAKTHLSSLLKRVAQGESFTITRHGKPVARLVPAQQRDPERIKAAIRRIKEIAAGQTLGGNWREFRDAGRKW